MSHMYAILAVVGWSWTAIVAVYLVIRLRGSKSEPRGFDVIAQHEKQS